MDTEDDNTAQNKVFPFLTLRVLGSLQVSIGVFSVTLGVVDLTLMLVTDNINPTDDVLYTMTIASAPIWSGTWFMVTGSLGTCVSRERPQNIQYIKNAFLVLNVLCAVLFAPACFTLSGMIAILRHTADSRNLVWLLSTATLVLAFCEFVLSVISASVCCCCAPLRMNKIHSFAEPCVEPALIPYLIPVRPDPDHDRDDHPPSKVVRTIREVEVQTDPPKAQVPPALVGPNRQPNGFDKRLPLEPRYLMSPDPYELTSYNRLKNWALPLDRERLY